MVRMTVPEDDWCQLYKDKEPPVLDIPLEELHSTLHAQQKKRMNGNSTKRHVKVMKSCTESKAQHRAGRGPSQPLNLGCLLCSGDDYSIQRHPYLEAVQAVNDYIFIVIFFMIPLSKLVL